MTSYTILFLDDDLIIFYGVNRLTVMISPPFLPNDFTFLFLDDNLIIFL